MLTVLFGYLFINRYSILEWLVERPYRRPRNPFFCTEQQAVSR